MSTGNIPTSAQNMCLSKACTRQQAERSADVGKVLDLLWVVEEVPEVQRMEVHTCLPSAHIACLVARRTPVMRN